MIINYTEPLFRLVRTWIIDQSILSEYDSISHVCDKHNIDLRLFDVTVPDELITYILMAYDHRFV